MSNILKACYWRAINNIKKLTSKLFMKALYRLYFLKLKAMIFQYVAVIIAAILLLREINDKIKLFFENHSKMRIGLVLIFLFINLAIVYQQGLKDRELNDELSKLREESNYEGDLSSPPTVLLSTKDGIFPLIQLGRSNVSFASHNSELNFKQIPAMRNLSIEVATDPKGKLLVSTDIYDKNGLIASIKKNHFTLNRNMIMSKKYNDSALEVKDNNGDIVLQILLKNDRIQLQGKFYDPGNGWVWGVGEDKYTDYGLIEISKPDFPTYPHIDMTISTIFPNNPIDVSAVTKINNFLLYLYTMPFFN